MNKLRRQHADALLGNTAIVFLIMHLICQGVHALEIGGPITADNVTVSGPVTLSSVTVSSLTITNLLNFTGAISDIPGSVIQMKFSSTTVSTTISTSSWQPISDLGNPITLTNSTNYVRISLFGTVRVSSGAYVTVMRGAMNLGQSATGIASVSKPLAGGADLVVPVGFTLTDAPGDLSSHTYQPYIQSTSTATARFVSDGVGYFVIEEIGL